MNLQFKKATFADASKLSKLVNSAYRGDSSKAGWTTEEHLLDGLRTNKKKIKDMIGEHHIEVALDEKDEIIGCVYLENHKTHLYLGMLTINPYIQTKGFGKALLEQSEKIAKAWGVPKIKMTVIDTRAELISFYERRGYAFNGATKPFPTDDPVFGILKVGQLMFKEFEKKIS